jgi:hypothetical protein
VVPVKFLFLATTRDSLDSCEHGDVPTPLLKMAIGPMPELHLLSHVLPHGFYSAVFKCPFLKCVFILSYSTDLKAAGH